MRNLFAVTGASNWKQRYSSCSASAPPCAAGANSGVVTSTAPASIGCGGSVSVTGVPSGAPPSTHAATIAFWAAVSVTSSWNDWQLPSLTMK